MKIGITGSREGMNNAQQLAVLSTLNEIMLHCKLLKVQPEFHHGDCKGVDEIAAGIAKELGYRIVCHPPESNYLRAYFLGDEIREPLGYLKRDRNIVDECEALLVVPLHNEWQPRGGTWFTHDYAVKKNKPLIVFYPNIT